MTLFLPIPIPHQFSLIFPVAFSVSFSSFCGVDPRHAPGGTESFFSEGGVEKILLATRAVSYDVTGRPMQELKKQRFNVILVTSGKWSEGHFKSSIPFQTDQDSPHPHPSAKSCRPGEVKKLFDFLLQLLEQMPVFGSVFRWYLTHPCHFLFENPQNIFVSNAPS